MLHFSTKAQPLATQPLAQRSRLHHEEGSTNPAQGFSPDFSIGLRVSDSPRCRWRAAAGTSGTSGLQTTCHTETFGFRNWLTLSLDPSSAACSLSTCGSTSMLSPALFLSPHRRSPALVLARRHLLAVGIDCRCTAVPTLSDGAMKPTAGLATTKRARRGRRIKDDILPIVESILEDLGPACLSLSTSESFLLPATCKGRRHCTGCRGTRLFASYSAAGGRPAALQERKQERQGSLSHVS